MGLGVAAGPLGVGVAGRRVGVGVTGLLVGVGGTGGAVGVSVTSGVGVIVGVSVGVGVGVSTGVAVCVDVGVKVGLGVLVGVGVEVGDAMKELNEQPKTLASTSAPTRAAKTVPERFLRAILKLIDLLSTREPWNWFPDKGKREPRYPRLWKESVSQELR
ncbi:MAG TPA: hypothetical protein VJ714_00270 [Anaerolineae bacterium]|nr:hypothetical protein [Anaerolineae bacterium]